MPVSAIILAAGRGVRFGVKVSKLLSNIRHKPVIAYSLERFEQHPSISEIVVVVNRANKVKVTSLIKALKIKKAAAPVLGGKRRQDSVLNGLKAAKSFPGLVLIHDAARPFVEAGIISALIKKAGITGAAIPAIPVRSTIKKVSAGMTVEKTIARPGLWEVQTPQAFDRGVLLMAYRRFGRADVTDDAMLVEMLGVKVGVVEGSERNIKITTRQDMVLAEAILRQGRH